MLRYSSLDWWIDEQTEALEAPIPPHLSGVLSRGEHDAFLASMPINDFLNGTQSLPAAAGVVILCRRGVNGWVDDASYAMHTKNMKAAFTPQHSMLLPAMVAGSDTLVYYPIEDTEERELFFLDFLTDYGPSLMPESSIFSQLRYMARAGAIGDKASDPEEFLLAV